MPRLARPSLPPGSTGCRVITGAATGQRAAQPVTIVRAPPTRTRNEQACPFALGTVSATSRTLGTGICLGGDGPPPIAAWTPAGADSCLWANDGQCDEPTLMSRPAPTRRTAAAASGQGTGPRGGRPGRARGPTAAPGRSTGECDERRVSALRRQSTDTADCQAGGARRTGRREQLHLGVRRRMRGAAGHRPLRRRHRHRRLPDRRRRHGRGRRVPTAPPPPPPNHTPNPNPPQQPRTWAFDVRMRRARQWGHRPLCGRTDTRRLPAARAAATQGGENSCTWASRRMRRPQGGLCAAAPDTAAGQAGGGVGAANSCTWAFRWRMLTSPQGTGLCAGRHQTLADCQGRRRPRMGGENSCTLGVRRQMQTSRDEGTGLVGAPAPGHCRLAQAGRAVGRATGSEHAAPGAYDGYSVL